MIEVEEAKLMAAKVQFWTALADLVKQATPPFIKLLTGAVDQQEHNRRRR